MSQLPVLQAEPPVMAAEVVGSIVERDLLDALVTGRASPTDPVGEHMSPPLPMVGLRRAGQRARSPRWRRRAPRWCSWTASRPA